MKKIICCLGVAVVMFGMFGCGPLFVGGLGSTEYEVALGEKILEKIVHAIEEKDKEALKSLLSPSALQQAKDIDEGIEYTFNLFQGKMVSFQSTGTRYTEHIGNPGNNKGITATFDIKTTEGKTYVLYYKYYYLNEENAGMIGVYRIKLTDSDNLPEEYDNGIFGGSYNLMGVYSPSWEEWRAPPENLDF